MDLRKAVRDKIALIGVEEATKYFGVSAGTVSNWSTGKTAPSIDAAQMVLTEQPVADPVADVPTPELVQWDGRKVMMLLPVYKSFSPHTHYTLFANYAKYGPEKIGMEIKMQTVIHESRNILIHNAMNNTKAETFIMVDDDMVLPTGNPGHINGVYRGNLPVKAASEVALSRIMSHGSDKGIVGALYVGRHSAGRAQCESGFTSDAENKKLHTNGYDGLKKEGWVATGMIKIERWVIEKMKEAIDAGEFPDCKPEKGRWYGYFNPLKVGVGEDVSFGTRAAKLGIQSYLDTGLICLHMGDQAWGPGNTSS